MVKLSIITINYNNCEGLRKTIDSILSQSWHEFEWIIVDGGSTDGSKTLIQETATNLGSHCFYWCSEVDRGIFHAMNKGLARSQGDYCLFLNSGDYFFDTKVLEKVFYSGVSADLEFFDQIYENSAPLAYSCRISEKSFSTAFLIRYTFPHQASLIRRELLRRLGGYDECLKIVSDWKFFLQAVVFENATCRYTHLHFAIVQAGGISANNDDLRLKERRSVLEELFPPRILSDYSKVESLTDVLESSSISRILYSLLYRLSSLLRRRENVF